MYNVTVRSFYHWQSMRALAAANQFLAFARARRPAERAFYLHEARAQLRQVRAHRATLAALGYPPAGV